MNIVNKVRAFDSFGTPFGLNYGGEDSSKTLGGGAASLSLKILAFSFFCIRLIAVVAYEDPAITSYDILSNRIDGENYEVDEYGLQLYFGFTDNES